MEHQDSPDHLETSTSPCPPASPSQSAGNSLDVHLPPAAENDAFHGHSEADGMSLLSTTAFSSRGITRSQSYGDLRPKPKPKGRSFIQPAKTQPKKADPVSKYHQYKQLWEARKPPGESDRRALRWETRNHLANSQIPHTRLS